LNALQPKKGGARSIGDIRPIGLINAILKNIFKVLTDQLK